MVNMKSTKVLLNKAGEKVVKGCNNEQDFASAGDITIKVHDTGQTYDLK
jgi:hypothetical protein